MSKILDIWCQHLGDECFYWIYAANIWRKYVILRVSFWGMNIFYWIYAANIWEYMSVGGFLWALRAQGWEMYCGEKSPTAFSCTLASQHFPTRQRIRFPTAACSMQTSTSEIWCNSFRDTCHHISQPCQGLQSSFSPAWRRLQGNAKMFRSEAWGTWSRPQPCPYFIVYKRCSVGCVVVVGGRKVMYTIENHLFHPAKGAPQKRDDLPRKKGTLLVPVLPCPPSILMGNGGGTPPPPSLFTGAQSFIAYTMSPSLQRRMIRQHWCFSFQRVNQSHMVAQRRCIVHCHEHLCHGLLAPSGALVFILVYYIPSSSSHFLKFFKFFRF